MAINQPFIRFQQFLENLSDAQKAQLMAMKNPDGRTLAAILNDLDTYEPGGLAQCVEIASRAIDALLSYPGNAAILDGPRPEKPSKLELKKSISPVGYAHSLTFPSKLTTPLISKMTLRHIDDFLTLLISVPPESYGSYFSQIKIEFRERWMELLPKELAALLCVAAEHRNAEIFEEIISQIAREKRQVLFLTEDGRAPSPLLAALNARGLMALRYFLSEKVTEKQRFSDVLTNKAFAELLYLAVKQRRAGNFSEVLKDIAPENRQAVLLTEDDQGRSPMLFAARNQSTLQLALRAEVAKGETL